MNDEDNSAMLPAEAPRPRIDRIERFQSLQSGQFWRAKKAHPEQGIDQGEVLLIKSLRYDNDDVHTVIVQAHPSKITKHFDFTYVDESGNTKRAYGTHSDHRFLLEDFLRTFEFEPDAKKIREAELRKVQQRLSEKQAQLIEAQSNPALLAEVVEAELHKAGGDRGAALPAPDNVRIATGSLADAIGSGLTESSVQALRTAADHAHQVATIKANWLKQQTEEVVKTLGELSPFFSEQAAACLAETEDTRSHVAKIQKGIDSLDLYVGKDVTVTTIREGASAPFEEPLTFLQKKLLMDEECAVFIDVDERFDFQSFDAFADAIRANDALIEQIFPTPRCVLVMASTRRYIDYGADLFSSAARNRENQNVFLLVRNGENVHRVDSPVESHLRTARLFPTKDDHERIFKGFDGRKVTVDDVSFTDHRAREEDFALHYKRFLLLAAGLDHRLKLFGEFYEGAQSLSFVSLDFQERHCRFLHDDNGNSLGSNRLPYDEWIKLKNAYLRSGSRVLGDWMNYINPKNAPGACFAHNVGDGFEIRYEPVDAFSVVIAFREGDDLYSSLPVEDPFHVSAYKKRRKFNARVQFNSDYKWRYARFTEDLGWLCLDAVEPAELEFYIHSRTNRENHIHFIRFFKRALAYLKAEREAEAPTRKMMRDALESAGLAEGDRADSVVTAAINAWRSAHRGAAVPAASIDQTDPDWVSLLGQMYILATDVGARVAAAEAFAEARGYRPLRMVVSASGKIVLYAQASEEERDDRLIPHCWVHHLTLEPNRKGLFIEKARRWTLLPALAASETTLKEWDDAAKWAGLKSVFPSLEAKKRAFALVDQAAETIALFSSAIPEDKFAGVFDLWATLRTDLANGTSMPVAPDLLIPIGVALHSHNKPFFICVGAKNAHVLLNRLAPSEEWRERILTHFIAGTNSRLRKACFDEYEQTIASDKWRWKLYTAPLSLADNDLPPFSVAVNELNHQIGYDPRLATSMQSWIDKNKPTRHDKVGTRYLLNPAVLDEGGKLCIDKPLGCMPKPDWRPLRVTTMSASDSGGKQYTIWCDIVDILTTGENPLTASPVPEVMWRQQEGYSGFGYDTATVLSMEAARAHVLRVAAKSGGASSKKRAVLSTDLDDAPAPQSDVIERWVLVDQA